MIDHSDMNRFDAACYRIIELLFLTLGRIPRPTAVFLGKMLGQIWYMADANRRRITIGNLARAFRKPANSWEIRRLARSVFQNICQIPFEVGRVARMSPDEFDRHFHIKGFDKCLELLKRQKGAVAITGHMGNWELLSVIAAMTGNKAHVVYRPLDFKPLDAYINRLRTRFGSELIPKSHAMRPILRALSRGGHVVIFPDQSVDWYDGVFVEFFGRPACTSSGAALIALKTGAPVFTIFLVRTPEGFAGEFGPEIPLIRTGDKIRDVEENTQRFNDAVEAFIRRYPEQWFWVHRRWKTRSWCPWPRQERR